MRVLSFLYYYFPCASLGYSFFLSFVQAMEKGRFPLSGRHCPARVGPICPLNPSLFQYAGITDPKCGASINHVGVGNFPAFGTASQTVSLRCEMSCPCSWFVLGVVANNSLCKTG